jgi:crossover junction endodeoxyribonuclease RuvC
VAKGKVPLFEYSPTEIKKGLTGSGRAEKDQVQMMVRALLGLPALGKYDMSDALALAIHHNRVGATMSQIRKAELAT